MLPSFDHANSKRRQKKQSTKHQQQPEVYITNDQYENYLNIFGSNQVWKENLCHR